MLPCFGLHKWSIWGDCFSAGDGRVMQARYCLHCRRADTRTVVQAKKPAAGVSETSDEAQQARNGGTNDHRA